MVFTKTNQFLTEIRPSSQKADFPMKDGKKYVLHTCAKSNIAFCQSCFGCAAMWLTAEIQTNYDISM